MNELRLVLTFKWFDRIKDEQKRLEYRTMSQRNIDLICAWLRRGKPYYVTFSRGYTRTITTWSVETIIINIDQELFVLKLGERVL